MTVLINLYDKNETSFVTNGLVVLSDCKSCFNTEELNGQYETELEYPIDGRGKWQYLIEGNIIKVGGQLFRIYRKVKTLGYIKINARHIFYDMLDNLVEEVDIRTLTGSTALDRVMSNTIYPHGFTYMSDITSANTITLDDETGDIINRNPVEAIFFLISLYNAELVRDNHTFKLLQQRGQDKGVLISYGKNIKGIEEELNINDVITRIKPIGTDGLTLPEKFVDSPNINNFYNPKVKAVEFSDCNDYESLRTAAQNYFTNTKCDIPLVNYKIDFVELSKTEEYKNYRVLETLYLGDTITVRHSKLNLNLKAKVILIQKNHLTNRIEKIELGNFKSTVVEGFNNSIQEVSKELINNKTYLQKAINNATLQINSALGGYVLKRNGELLIMDTEDVMTATKVWRWNTGGLGYSGTGYNGPYETAITADGHIVADFIDTGVLTANIIKSGLLKSFNNLTWINMDNGTFDFGGKITFDGTNFHITLSSGKTVEEEIGTVSSSLDNFINNTYSSDMLGLQNQIDGNITTWFYDGLPTLNSLPSSEWDTDAKKDVHLGDLYYDNLTGYAYRFRKTTLYEWFRISDTDVVAALANASKAQDTADSKRRVFTSQPVPPYDIGDLWSGGPTGDLRKCKVVKTSGGVYDIADWELATKYTDDSTLNNFITNTYATDKNNLQGQIDGKANTFYQTTMPHTEYTNIVDNPTYNTWVGDLWYDSTSTVKKTYVYVKTPNDSNFDYKWQQQEIPKDIFDILDGKKTIYTTKPTSYKKDDLWILESDAIHTPNKQGEILTATANNTIYIATDWVVKVRYTDDTVVGNFINNTYATDKSDLRSQIDGKIETYFQETDPNTWAVGDRAKHNGDMWFKTTVGAKALYRYNSTSNAWEQIQDQTAIDAYNDASAAQDTADSKRRVFISTPTIPYDVGDLWSQGTSGDLMKCKVARATGSYQVSDWEKASKYTDDTLAQSAVDGLNTLNNTTLPSLTNRVTNVEQLTTPDSIISTVSESFTYYKDTLLPKSTTLTLVRAGLAINPLTSYNPTSLTAVPNNTFVTIVGGTEEYIPYLGGLEIVDGRSVVFEKQIDRVQAAESAITQNANNISLVITQENGTSVIDSASIIAAINEDGTSKIDIAATNIDLSGYVTFSNLSTVGETTIDGGNIKTNSIGASSIKTDELIVGENISMGANATISWSKVTDQPEIPSQYADSDALAAWVASEYKTHIDQNGVYTGSINANQITGTTFNVSDYIQFMKGTTKLFKIGLNASGNAGQLYLNDTCSLDTNGLDLRMKVADNNYIRINTTGGLDYYYPTGESTYNVIPIVDSNGVLQTGTGSSVNVVVTPKFG